MAEVNHKAAPVLISKLTARFYAPLVIILLVWLASFIVMINTKDDKAKMIAYFGMGLSPLVMYGLLLSVKRLALYDDRLAVINYWKKEKESLRWDEVSHCEGDFDESILLQKKNGGRIDISDWWVGNMKEVAEFISARVSRSQA